MPASAEPHPGSSPPGERDEPRRQSRAEPARPLDPRLLRAAFQDLLGRPPFSAERALWAGRGLHELLDEWLGRLEFWEEWYEEQLYYFLLVDRFRPAAERVAEIPADLARGALDVREALHRIALSPSFDRRNPGPDTFVSVVMEQLCGLTVQQRANELEIGKRVYDGGTGLFLGQRVDTQAGLVDAAVRHELFPRHLLAREHERILGVVPERRALLDWARELERDPRSYPARVRAWLLSETYRERLARPLPTPNRLFVRSLWVDLCDRLPDPQEERALRAALDGLGDPGPLRAVLARLLLDSGAAALPEKDAIEDPTTWVADLFRRLLGREAGEDELRAFVTAFHREACRPATVVFTLASSPEYQSR